MNSSIKNILVVVTDAESGEIALDKAFSLAQKGGARLHVLTLVYTDYADLTIHDEKTRQEIRDSLCESARNALEKLLAPLRDQDVELTTTCQWQKYEWQGVTEHAEQINADLIVKATEFPVREVVRTPADWNLLRHSDAPVLLVKPINWVDRPIVLASIDVIADEDLELNRKILRRGAELARTLNGSLHVINIYPSVEHWVGPITIVIDFDHVRTKVHQEISAKVETIVEELEIDVEQVHTREGHAEVEIQRTVEETGAEILVMGTHHRDGAKGMVMGNTSEKILHTARCDVEVLH